ncbi:HPF/RaiA family ribosome-associated protein [Qipengyuania oceanensis]|uniref:HPF/RaiA family ribosome-associated protein n=1 Tax=Qipengyuania oceanensis TaxID=1463597 RepID=A0A844YLG7_9SPHN|nr:HPF/RaiA family ribosome-associated protein [Qipengyuania oceanensis]MXO63774.1 HPF/RaiA family ribosome-associated protein [Qipengyuania oceanensis]
MQVQFNSDSSVMGTANVAERIEAMVREKLARFESKLTRVEIHVRDENGSKHGADDKSCTIEARPAGGRAIGVTEKSDTVDAAARKAANTLAQRLQKVLDKSHRHDHDQRPEKAL